MATDPDLRSDIGAAHWWLAVSLAQLHEGHPWDTAHWGADPVGKITLIDALRPRLESQGVLVPEFPAPMADPLACMHGWHDFLETFVTVH